ncbi:hypothetical protein Tco_1474076 [Tanacetum coccineum]
MKAITTQSGVAYEGPSIPTNPSPKKTLPKPNIPYPSCRNDQKSRDKASNQMEKIFQIFQDLRFDISFADALLLMPRFAPTIKSFLLNKEKLIELAKIPLNGNCSAMLLKKLPEKPGDPGKFLIPSDPRVPIILGRSFLRTGRALIDVYGEEITLRVDNEAITFNLDQTTRYSSTNDKSVNRIDIIDEVCKEYAPELLGFSNKSSGGNPTLTYESFTSEFILEEIEAYLKDDSISPEIDHADCDPEGDICLIENLLNNDPFQLPLMDLKQGEVMMAKSSMEEPPELELKDLPSHLEYAYLEENDKLPVIIAKDPQDQEKTTFTCPYGTFAYRRMPFGLCNAPGTFQRCMMAIFHDMIEKTMEVFMDDFSVFRDSFDLEGIVLGHKISNLGIEVDRAKFNIIAKLPHLTTLKGVRSFQGHASFYRCFIQDFSKIARPMTHLLEKETPFVFSKDCIDAFKTLKKKLTEAPILVVPD